MSAKTFDADVASLEFDRVIRSTNGEDVLYVFHARVEGRTLLLPYNVIRKEIATPIPCHGWSLFDDGTLVVFRAMSEEPTRVHPMQVWQTPYLSDTYAAAQPVGTGPLERVGNAELVRGISDVLSVSRMVDEMAPSAAVFEALIAACDKASDHYHWLGEPELGDLRGPLADVRATAEQVLDEFEKVQSLTAEAAAALDEAAAGVATLVRAAKGEAPKTADAWVAQLAELRRAQGRLVSLKELRYVDVARVDELAGRLAAELTTAAQRAVEYLRGADAFAGYQASVERLVADAEAITTVVAAGPVTDRLADQSAGLDILTEVVGSLDIADATVRTGILERIGTVLGGVNRARATVDARRRELLSAEGRSAFAAEMALLGQAITGALAVADSPERCDEQLGRLLLRLEDLESRFGEFDDFLSTLGAKRDDVYEAFSSRKQALLDERARRAERLVTSADRILGSVQRRVATLGSVDEVNTYFAADPMVAKLGGVAVELRELGDQVRAEELAGRVKAARQEAGRALRDRLDLFGAGGDTIRLGRHHFAVNTQPMDLTLVPHGDHLAFAITGTDYRSPVDDEAFGATRKFWDQNLISESPAVYRGEHLAAAILAAAEQRVDGLTLDGLHAAAVRDGGLLDVVRRVAEARIDEGYERGVHDHDTALILDVLLRLHTGAGLLRYPPAVRAEAQLFWAFGTDEPARVAWATRARSLARARQAFGRSAAVAALCAELAEAITAAATTSGKSWPSESPEATTSPTLSQERSPEATTSPTLSHEGALAGEYLFEELATAPFGFVTGAGARCLVEGFRQALGGAGSPARKDLDDDLRALGTDLAARRQLVEAWLASFVESKGGDTTDLPEAVAIELCRADLPRHDSSAALSSTVDGLLGAHPRIVERRLERASRRAADPHPGVPYRTGAGLPGVPGAGGTPLATAERDRLRLGEYQPKVMSAFVRNRLLDEVYLPLIGDNLAKQLGRGR